MVADSSAAQRIHVRKVPPDAVTMLRVQLDQKLMMAVFLSLVHATRAMKVKFSFIGSIN